ncbi:MAG: hypothetical protein HY291_23020 [Planctomycetes bacterium]|nr:hypothetical protein [Planctomycetota bacterium]
MNQSVESSKQKRLLFLQRFVGAIAIISLISCVVIVVLMVRAASTASEAEHTLQVTIETSKILSTYVKDYPGRWPKSWEDLSKSSSDKGHILTYNLDEFKKRVYVDFDANLDELATQKPETFSAVRPIGPCFDSYKVFIPELIESINTSLGASNSDLEAIKSDSKR